MIQTSQLSEKLDDTFEQVGTVGRTAGRKLDEVRRGTADALAGSASSVRNAGEAIDELAERAAAQLDSTAACIRRNDVSSVLSNLQQVIRRHPASLVMGAAAVGFVFGVAVRRR